MAVQVSVALGTALLVVCAAPMNARSTPQQPDLSGVLQRGATYLDSYQKKLATVIAQEDYMLTGPAGLFRDDGGRLNLGRLTSDILLVGTDGGWVEFRDVYERNGRPVRDHQARLEVVLGGPDVLGKAQAIADESARYTGWLIPRNVNVPTMALAYLSRSNQGRSAFRLQGNGDDRTMIVGFNETARPPLIHSSAGTAETSGRFWVDPNSGAVRKTELVIKIPQGDGVQKGEAVSGSITVTYTEDGSLKLLVPHEMQETYDAPLGVRGHATYSHYKSFDVIVNTKIGRGGGR
jgi:hypothetical protein